MTYLQLCQKANQLCGLQGDFTSVVTATGYQVTLADFIAEAWIDIQNLRKDWPFLSSSVSWNTVVGQHEYTMAQIGKTDLARWVPGMVYFLDDDGKTSIPDYITFEEYVRRDIELLENSPVRILAQDPIDKHIYINPPDDIYSMLGYYITKPVTLAADADVPLLPEAFHTLIAYQGAAQMGTFMGNTNMFNLLAQKSDVMLGSLMRSELPSRSIKLNGIA